MNSICLILFLAIVSLWFFSIEYPTLFGIYVPASALKRIWFKILAGVTMICAVLLSTSAQSDNVLLGTVGVRNINPQSYVVIILSSLITLLSLRMLGLKSSVIYAFIGSFQAYALTSAGKIDHSVFLPVLTAPFLTMLIAAAINFFCRKTIDRSHIHLITLSYYMRFAVIAGIVLIAFAFGMNWGGFIIAAGKATGSPIPVPAATAVVFAVSMFALSHLIREESDESAGQYSDFSIYTVLSVGFSVALTLLFFSFDKTSGLLGMRACPLSPSSLIFAGIAGCELVQKSRFIERDEYAKEGMSLILTPSAALLISYIIFYLSGRSKEHIEDFTVMSAAVLVCVALFFASYVRRQLRQKEMMDRLVYTQQQQIYENSRALNDMELKVVISENQALHNSIEMKKQEVRNVALSMVEQKEYLESLNNIVKKLSKAKEDRERDMLIAELSVSLKQRLSYDRDVDSQYFASQAEYIHEDFNAKLAENFPDLTQQERRLATLLRLGFSSKYIATLMSITPKSVEISRYRLRQKLGLSKGDNLVNFIKSI